MCVVLPGVHFLVLFVDSVRSEIHRLWLAAQRNNISNIFELFPSNITDETITCMHKHFPIANQIKWPSYRPSNYIHSFKREIWDRSQWCHSLARCKHGETLMCHLKRNWNVLKLSKWCFYTYLTLFVTTWRFILITSSHMTWENLSRKWCAWSYKWPWFPILPRKPEFSTRQ